MRKTFLFLIITLFFPAYGQNPLGEGSPNTALPDYDRLINTNKPVYKLPTSLAINNGNAFYDIPVEVPAGIGGIQPTVSINYNSSGVNAQMGLGWNIKATQAITRRHRSMIFGDETTSLDWSVNDELSLNGQLLVPMQSARTSFRTLVESNQKVERISDVNGDYFKVTTEN